MYRIFARLAVAVAVAVAGMVIGLLIFALLFARGAYDCPDGTYQVSTVWVDMETGEERVDSICVQQR